MKKIKLPVLLLFVLLLASCNSGTSLQEYYVNNSENPNFIALDLPASILNMDMSGLSEAEQLALKSLRKLNVLAFRLTPENTDAYQMEKSKVTEILKDDDFVELMKLNSQYGKGVIKYLGDDDAIDEVVIYGSSDDKGFALIRVLGKNMNPAHLMQLVKALQKANYQGDQLGEIGSLLKG